MKTNPVFHAVVLATVLLATGASAQTASPAPPADATPMISPMPAPNQIIYIPQLPNPAELANAAAAQGVTVEQINQTSTQITVVYKYANGQTNTICYQLLSNAGAAPAVGALTGAPVTTVVPTTTNVVYATPSPAYYYYPYGYSYPYGYYYPWYAPVSIGLGFNFGYGYGHGGYHGGYHGGGGYHGHGR
jgi:hypothetical protein